ncbi:MAG: beta-lactamase family protein [Nitrospirota bacterium]|nr:beta-lactamase family protein [Nitrospirota bacterium]
MKASDPIAGAMQSAVEAGVFPGAVLLVRLQGAIRYHRAFGLTASVPLPEPAHRDTIYDLASLTKPLATATAVLCLVQDGSLSLDRTVQDCLPELQGCPVGRATIAHLLTHSSGLPAWRPFYERVADQDKLQPGFLGSPAAKAYVLQLIGEEELLAPIGAQAVYSDLGFMLLGLLVERLTGRSLAAVVRERIYGPIKAEPLSFVPTEGAPPAFAASAIAPTEDDPWRGRMLRGEVHDENAYALGGVAGHAGLFGTAAAVLAVSGCWLDAVTGKPSLLRADLAQRSTSRQEIVSRSSWGLGWDSPSPPSSSGTKFSPRSFGHLGYTGTSLWVDPERELEVVLLSNRVHPTRKNEKIREFRPLIHDVIYKELIG